MKYFTIDLNGKDINFRLTSQDSIKIEKTYNVKPFDYIQDYSITTIINLLRYMRRGGGEPSFSQDDAEKFFDELVDNEWSLEKIVKEIIMPTCQVSGLLTKSDLQRILEEEENQKATQK